MPNQTAVRSLQFPDGFVMEISSDDGSSFEDVGVLAGGAQVTFNWDQQLIDAGNVKELVNDLKNMSVSLAPSALMSWSPDVIKEIWKGIFTSASTSTPGIGCDIENVATERITPTKLQVRMTHYTDTALDTADFQFTLYNACVDAGGAMNFKGVNEDGLDEITVSFTGRPDYTSSGELFKFFKLTPAA
jgi:hypothetical protein